MALMICKYDIMLYIALGILAHSEAKKKNIQLGIFEFLFE